MKNARDAFEDATWCQVAAFIQQRVGHLWREWTTDESPPVPASADGLRFLRINSLYRRKPVICICLA
jgi:hypothetical protein